jgi:hypothetical protein
MVVSGWDKNYGPWIITGIVGASSETKVRLTSINITKYKKEDNFPFPGLQTKWMDKQQLDKNALIDQCKKLCSTTWLIPSL